MKGGRAAAAGSRLCVGGKLVAVWWCFGTCPKGAGGRYGNDGYGGNLFMFGHCRCLVKWL
jgi:hypothetical protein